MEKHNETDKIFGEYEIKLNLSWADSESYDPKLLFNFGFIA